MVDKQITRGQWCACTTSMGHAGIVDMSLLTVGIQLSAKCGCPVCMLVKKIVSVSFIERSLNKYPALAESRKLRGLFRWLCFSTFHDDESGLLVVPRSLLWAEVAPEIEERAFNVAALLREMQDKVLPDLRWSSWSRGEGRARQILADGFDDEMKALLDEELRLPFDKDFAGMVNFVTGRRYDKSRLYPAVEAHRRLVREAKLNPTQAKVLGYLDVLDGGRLFLPKLARNREAIDAAIAKLPARVGDIQRRILHAVMEQPQVLYRPGDRSCRLSGCGDTVLGLKSEVRRALCSGWSECDLRSSQFAILTTVLDAPISKALIDSGVSLWRSLYLHTHEVDADPPKVTKALFKEVVYSVAFGKSAANLARVLRPHGLERLLHHPVLQELLHLRAEWFERIETAGGAEDVWGTWQAIRRGKDCAPGERPRLARHIAATVVQSIEMKIIAPIFDIARTHGNTYQFGIVLFQHDGATISFQARGARKERAMTLLRGAVETRARELGVRTTLEFTDLRAADVPSVVPRQDQTVEEIVAELEAELIAGGHITDAQAEPCHLCGKEQTEFYEGEVIAAWCCAECWDLADDAEDRIALDREHERFKPLTKTSPPCSAIVAGAFA